MRLGAFIFGRKIKPALFFGTRPVGFRLTAKGIKPTFFIGKFKIRRLK